MKIYFDGVAILVASAWVGSMWAIAYIAAPVLFYALPDKALAGMLAGKLFAVLANVGMACAVFLLIYIGLQNGKKSITQAVFWFVALMLLLTTLGQFILQPILADLKVLAMPHYVMESPYADRFRFWHGVASVVYLVQSVCGAALLLKMNAAMGRGKG